MKRSLDVVVALAVSFAAACGGAPAEVRTPAPARVSATPAPEGTAAKLAWSLAGEHRDAEDRARDGARHPTETLSFFGLKDDMTVVELYPGYGWYTDVLAPVLRDRGKLVVTNWDPATNKYGASYANKLKAAPGIYDRVTVNVIAPPKSIPIGADGSADLVLTFRNFHNWLMDGDAEAICAAAFRVLKPGGTFGVVEHRAVPDTTLDQMKKSGYVTEAKVIELATAAGFTLAGKSEVNANPRDTKDHPNGVWSLPPALRGGAVDKARFVAIGESDRMTLKFKKP